MPSLIQSAFSTGEVAPEYYGRTDLGLVYQHGLKQCRNFVALPQGGAARRPGMQYVAPAESSTGTVRLWRCVPASSTVYTLEFGAGYIRFYRNRAQVQSGGSPYSVSTPYAANELQGLSFTPYQKTLWIFHPNHPVQTLTWSGADTAWTLAAAPFTDGPYLDPVMNATTLTPAAAGVETTNVTASATAGINGGAGFQAGDVGRHMRFLQYTLGLSGIGINTAGSGYQAGDVINAATTGGKPLITLGGQFLEAQLAVTALSSTAGAISGVRIVNSGQFLIAPTGSLTQDFTDGNGSGFVGTPTYAVNPENPLWIWGIISDVISTTEVTVVLQASEVAADGTTENMVFTSTNAITTWRLGAWGGQEGYPAVGGDTFESRLVCGAAVNYPKRVWGSELPAPGTSAANFLSMSPSLASGQVVDSGALSFDLDDPQGDPIRWISPAGNAETAQIGVGTGNAEHIIQPGTQANELSPLSLQTYLVSRYSSAEIQPIRIGRFLLFVERSGRRLREWMYYWMAGGFVGPEASPYGKHLLLGGVKQLDYALAPHPTIWGCTQIGQLIGLTYMPEQSVATTPKENISAWHSHALGGSYYGGPPFVESVVCVPDEAGGDDQVWLSVIRADGAGLTKTIEVSSPYFRSKPVDQAVFVDNALTSPLTLPNATCTPVLAASYAPSGDALPQRGDTVSFGFSAAVASAGDTDPGTVLRINGGTFLVTAVNSSESVACQCIDTPATLAPAAAGNWSYTAMQTNFTGFDAHNGRVVTGLADGQQIPPQVVVNGTVTLGVPASYVVVGLPYTSILETLDLDLQAPDGTSQIKTGRVDHLYLRVFETLGGSYGPTRENLDAIEPRRASDLPNWAPALLGRVADANDDDGAEGEGDLRVAFPGGSSSHRRVYVEQGTPWPMTLLALVVKGGTMEVAPR